MSRVEMDKTLRLGIWCDYGFTLEPSEGIGVFVSNLVRGIAESGERVHVTLVPHPGQAAVLAPLAASYPDYVSVARRKPVSRLRRKLRRRFDKITQAASFRLAKSSITSSGVDFVERFRERTEASRCNGEMTRLEEDCDLWLLPYAGLSTKFSKPSVVVVHDLVSYHFDGVVRPAQLHRFKKQVQIQIAQAKRVACMAEFIRQNDLVKTLGIAHEKTAVVKAAAPADIRTEATVDRSQLLKMHGITRPFLFYPAAFRTYKNHRLLVRSLEKIRQSAIGPVQLVFTGIRSCPGWLSKEIRQYRVQADVRCLGKVSREELWTLYKSALATVVPSLYEQGSFPIMEAIHAGCPAFCSDIPQLREQFATMGDSMPFFDPHSPESLVERLQVLVEARCSFIAAQEAGFREFQKRTWRDAAHDWLALFNEIEAEQHDARFRIAA